MVSISKYTNVIVIYVIDRLKKTTHDQANGATKKWLNLSFGEGYFLPFFDLVFNDCFCFFERGLGVR